MGEGEGWRVRREGKGVGMDRKENWKVRRKERDRGSNNGEGGTQERGK